MGQLREYQAELIDRLFDDYQKGLQAPCIVLPCGGGKSVILAEIAKRMTEQAKQVLFLVHRQELCAQIFSTFVRWGVDMEFCEIAMVQTKSRHLKSSRYPDLIITDENHHSLANTYKKIYDFFPLAKRVGVTATPERTNGAGLIDVNDDLIVGVTAKWLIDNNFLSPYDYYAPAIQMPKFKVRNGDFVQSEVAEYFNSTKKIYGHTIKHYRRLADGKQAICYLPTVEFSKQTASKFSDSGIPSAHIDGETPPAERNQIIADFRDGKIKILCNVDIISEGFDVPDCECVILLRPTKSLILYTQQSMRCMRYKEGKRAIIIDHVGNINRFGFPDTERKWKLEGHPHKKVEGEAPVRVCPNCYATVPLNTAICPHCEFVFKKKQKKETELLDINLEKISSVEMRVKFYISPNECQSVDELKAYARFHKYKPGWVYFQQKARGWLDGERNDHTKRYPCRAVKSWHCEA